MEIKKKKFNKNKQKIDVSIIIPYFKKHKYFSKTIKSIYQQTYKNYEIILIYDDINIQELEFVKFSLKSIKNKKIIINKKNLGAGTSRNLGILSSKKNFIAFCDADDVWQKNKLKSQISFMKKNNYDFTHTSYLIIDNNSKTKGNFSIKKKINYNDLLKSCDVGLSTVICDRSILSKKLFPKLKTKEDYCLWLNILKKGKFLYGLNQNLTSWRKTDNSLSSSIIQKIFDSFKLYNHYHKYNVFMSAYLTIRLTIYAVLKKINIYI